MRISINLATRPYVELDRVLRQLRIAIGVLALLALALGVWLYMLSAKARQQQAQLHTLQQKEETLNRERAANDARLRQPVNAETLARNQFLNTLFARKSFSWTAVLMDLEDVLPTGVQVQSIEPILSSTGDVTIRMRVLGQRDNTVQLVRNLEHSHRFMSPRLAGETQQTAQRGANGAIGANGLPMPAGPTMNANGLAPISGVEFEIVSGYNPLQSRVHDKATEKAEKAKTDGAKADGNAKNHATKAVAKGVSQNTLLVKPQVATEAKP